MGTNLNTNYELSFSSKMTQQLSNKFYNQVMKDPSLGGYFGGFNRWCTKVRSELKSKVAKNQATIKKALGNPKINRQKVIDDACDRVKEIFKVDESTKLFNNKSNSRLAHTLSKAALESLRNKIDALKAQDSNAKMEFLKGNAKKK